MFDRSSALLMVTSLLALQVAGPARAGEGYFEGRVAAGDRTATARESWGSPLLPADPGPLAEIGRQSSALPQPPQSHPLPLPSGDRPWLGTFARTSQTTRPERLIRLPRVEPHLTGPAPHVGSVFPPGQLADGTWRDDGRYIVINLNGRQLRLLKESPAPGPHGTPNRAAANGSTVYGRLLNRGRPLVNCRVMIRPMIKTFTGHRLNRAVQPLRAITDGRGAYSFENVPPGPYKLAWLPEGTNQWIRRVAARPDLTVRENQTKHVKDIPVALRTIN